jgi:hypothetical protein
LPSYECHDKDNKSKTKLLVEIFVSKKDHKEKDVTKILEPIWCRDGHNEDVNQNSYLDIWKKLVNEPPAAPVAFVLDLVLEESKHGFLFVLIFHLVVDSNLVPEQQKSEEQQCLLNHGICHSPVEV